MILVVCFVATVLVVCFVPGETTSDQPLRQRWEGDLPLGREPCSRHASDLKWARLCGWLEDNGARGVENVFIGQFDHAGFAVRGIGAAKDLRRGELVFCIPQRCLSSSRTLSDRVKQLTDSDQCSDIGRHAIHLAEEARLGNESFLEPYLAMLPDANDYASFHPGYSNVTRLPKASLIYWPGWFTRLAQECHEEYTRLAKGTAVDRHAVLLAQIRIGSRKFGGVGMVPLLDMFNTAPVSDINIRPQSLDEGICVNAVRDIKKGEELIDDYGASSRSSFMFFSIYGFALGPEHHKRGNNIPGGVDSCIGSLSPLFPEPDVEKEPLLHNIWRFAQEHCAGITKDEL